MTSNLPLKTILAAIDLNEKSVWKELTEEQKKSITFFTLNRYISNAVGASIDIKELMILRTNEYYNKHLFTIMSKHKELTWQSACSSSDNIKKIFNHAWLPGAKKAKNKKAEFLAKLFPDIGMKEIETLTEVTTTNEIKQYCESAGWDKKEISKIKF